MTETNNETEVTDVPKDQFAQEVEAWPKPVDASCIDDAAAQLMRNFHIDEDWAYVGVLWDTHTYCYSEFEYSPRLIVTAPGPGHGKTRFLEALSYMAERPYGPLIATEAAYVRLASRNPRPTLFFDEGDKLFGKHGDGNMTQALNEAFQECGMFLRCGESNFDDLVPKRVFGPDAMCGIDLHLNMMGSTLERSLTIPMVKAKYGQIQEKFRRRQHRDLYRKHGQKVKRLVLDNLEDIRSREPAFPELPDERFEDKWWPILAIAESVSDTLAQRVRRIIQREADTPTKEDWKLNLILDLCRIYDEQSLQWSGLKGDNINLHGIGCTPASQLLVRLGEAERGGDRVWEIFNQSSKFRKSDALSPDQVTKALEGYGVKRRTLRCDDAPMMGFPWEEILEVRRQYSNTEYVPGEDELSEPLCNQVIDYNRKVAEVPF